MNALKALNYQTFTDFYSHKFLKQKNNLLSFVTLEIQHYRDWLTLPYLNQGMQKGKYHCTVDLFDWFGICSMTTDNFCFICKTDYSKPVKQEVDGTVILPPLVFPAWTNFN